MSESAQRRKHVIDPSAWISGISYFIGCVVAGGSNILSAIFNNTGAMVLLPLSYVAFIASVMLIQRHMKKSLLASTFGKPQTLVTSGIFAWSRHPIYAAFLMPLIALASISYPAAAIGIITYVILMEIFVIRPEEAELAQIFRARFYQLESRDTALDLTQSEEILQTASKAYVLITTLALPLAVSLTAAAGDEIKLNGTAALDSENCGSGTSNPKCVLNFSITGKAAKILYDGMPAKGVLQECTGDVEKSDKSGMHCIKGKTAEDFVCDFSYAFKNSKFGSGPDDC